MPPRSCALALLALAAISCGDPESSSRPRRERRAESTTIVTLVRGDVRLGDAEAPAVPFRVPEDRALRLGEGAHAVVLVAHRPERFDGPTEVDLDALRAEGGSDQAIAIRRILEGPAPAAPPDDLLRTPAPTDLDSIRLVVGEGMPGASNTLGRVEWRCDGDCAREVELRDANGTVLWRAQGSGSVSYSGPDLVAPSAYSLRLGERTYEIETLPRIAIDELFAAMNGWSLAERMSVIAALHHWRGSRAAAVATVRSALHEHPEDADLLALLAAYGAHR